MGIRLRGARVALLVALVSGSVFASVGSSQAAAPASRYMFAGHAFGTYAAGGGVNTGRSANVVMWCRTKPGIFHANSVASVSVPGVVDVGGVVSGVAGTALPNAGKKSVAAVNLANLQLLGGLVTADQLTAVSTTTRENGAFALSDAGAVFSNITVLGQQLPLPNQVPAPNTRVDLPGIGYLVLNEQTRINTPTRALLAVNMLHLHVTIDNAVLGIKKGLNVVLGHAASGLVETAGPLGGTAYVSKLTAGGLLNLGPSAALYLPCAGTEGKTRHNAVGSVGVPGVLSIGAGRNFGSGVVQPGKTTGQIASTAENVRLLAGLVTADAVNSRVTATRVNGVRTFKDASTGFVNLVVNGQQIAADAPVNTKIAIPGVGTMWVHHVVHTPHGLRVTMLELKVTQAGAGLPAGSTLRIASAQIAIF
jgi:hypothetical protein